MKITLLAGTNRPQSNTRRVVSAIARLYDALGQPADVLDLADLPAEIFDPGAYAEKPASFARFNDAILASDGVHIVTPEYNGSLPGVLKYFIDMLEFPASFEHRPVAFTGLAAGMWGGLRPVEQLQMILGYRNAHAFPDRVFLQRVGSLFSDGGELADAGSLKRLRAQAEGFLDFTRRLRAGSPP